MPASDLPSSALGHRRREPDALQQGARKKPYVLTFSQESFLIACICFRAMSNPLTHSSRHFGQAIFAFCHVQTLITNGLSQLADDPDLSSLHAQVIHLLLTLLLLTWLEYLGNAARTGSFKTYWASVMVLKTGLPMCCPKILKP
jgi:hypothetical protein